MGKYLPEQCAYCEAVTWCEIRKNGKPQCRGCKVERFFEYVLYPPIGLRLLDWQRTELRAMYGTVEPETGLRQYRRALIAVPKKNGKSFLVGGLPLYHLLMEDTEVRPEAFGAASAKDQGGIVFSAAAALVKANPDLSSRLRLLESTRRIVKRDGNGVYRVISADGDVNDGIEPSLVIADELHRWKTPKALALYSMLTKGTISRREALVAEITTAGAENESPLWMEEYSLAMRKANGEIAASRFYASIYAADRNKIESDPEYWKSREARVEANPSHEDRGGFLMDEKIADELEKALENPVKRNEYFRFHLNITVTSTTENAIEMHRWRECGGSVDLRKWPSLHADELRLLVSKWGLAERPCWVGIDASWTTDLTAAVFVFPPKPNEREWALLPFAWVPEEKIPELARKTKRSEIATWVERGFLGATPGNAVDLNAVKERIRWGAEMFELREIAFDPWNFRNTASDLAGEGFRCVEIPQNYTHLSAPTKKLLELYEDRRLVHGNHPVLNWNASCLALKGDHKDNVQPAKPERGKSANRVDLMSAAITAMARAQAQTESVYEGRGMVVLG